MNNIDNRGAVDWPQYVLGRFSDVRQEHNRDKWVACCPAHDDTHPSLAIGFGDNGSLILTCRAGCTIGAVLDRSGLEYSDLYPPDQRGQKRTTKPVGEPKPSASVAPHNKELREREQADALRAANNRWATLYTNPKRAEGLTILAGKLGVRADVLHGMGVVFDQERNAWMIPERGFETQHDNSDGTPKDNDANRQGFVGFHCRYHDGKKKHQTGTRRGLTYAKLKPDATAPRVIICPEGASDVAALLSMGIYAIGRPGAKSGKEHLRAFCNQHREWFTDDGAELVILGENDKGAGREGAKATAEYLKAKLPLLRVRWALPPADVKDARQWLNAQQADLNDANAMRALGVSFFGKLNFADCSEGAKSNAESKTETNAETGSLRKPALNKNTNIVRVSSEPDVTAFDEADGRPLDMQEMPCTHRCKNKFTTALQSKENPLDGNRMSIVCDRPSCRTCCQRRKVVIAKHVVGLIELAMKSQWPLFVMVAELQDAKRYAKQNDNADRRGEGSKGRWFALQPNPLGAKTFITTKPVKLNGHELTKPIPYRDAVLLVRDLCEEIDAATYAQAGVTKPLFTAGKLWRLVDDSRKTGKWTSLGTCSAKGDVRDRVVQTCKDLGVMYYEKDGIAGTSVAGSIRIRLPSHMANESDCYIKDVLLGIQSGLPADVILACAQMKQDGSFAELFPHLATNTNEAPGASTLATAPTQVELFADESDADDTDGPSSL